MGKNTEKLRKKAEKLSLNRGNRHIFLCADTGKCNCASEEQMLASWKYLKSRLKALGAAKSHVLYSRTQCLGICVAGPVAVVYPDGIWYAECDEVALEEIIQKHLLGGTVVEKYVFAGPPVAATWKRE